MDPAKPKGTLEVVAVDFGCCQEVGEECLPDARVRWRGGAASRRGDAAAGGARRRWWCRERRAANSRAHVCAHGVEP
jgi:hypothetical protein